MRIINTNKNPARELLDRAITKFRGAYKVPTLPKIRRMSHGSVLYNWDDIKATFWLYTHNNSASFFITQITQSRLLPAAPLFNFSSDDELINNIIRMF
ncbi:MAG: hypothetical protein WC516_07045 [Patescibacteria group bacterium]|jgi:hypothetical protein